MKQNEDVRSLVKEVGVKLWQVAEKLNLNDGNFSRKLRKELSPDDKKRVYAAIEELTKENMEA